MRLPSWWTTFTVGGASPRASRGASPPRVGKAGTGMAVPDAAGADWLADGSSTLADGTGSIPGALIDGGGNAVNAEAGADWASACAGNSRTAPSEHKA